MTHFVNIPEVYFFMIPSIAHIGGGEFYVARKVQYLRSLGVEVYVISTQKMEIKIPELKEFSSYIWEEMTFPISITPLRVINVIEKRFGRLLKDRKNAIIESNMVTLSPWAEYIASIYNIKHVVYLLTETFKTISPSLKSFFYFKLGQHLLYGITKYSIAYLLKTSDDLSYTELVAVGNISNQVKEIPLPIEVNKNNYDYVVICLGRLSKNYVMAATAAVCNFSKHTNLRVKLILVGGDASAREINNLKAIIDTSKNVDGEFTGALSPIPLGLFEIADVAISGAGCALICSQNGVPTITVDANDNKAIGILNVTTNNTTFRTVEPPIDIESLLDDVLIKKMYRVNKKKEENDDYSQHMKVMSITTKGDYYDINTLENERKYKLLKIIYHYSSFRFVRSIMNIYIAFVK